MPIDSSATGSKDPYVAGTHQETSPKQKVEEIQEIIKSAGTAMLVSTGQDGHLHSRAMAPASKEAPFVFEFIFNAESGKYDELKEHPKVNVAFYDTKSSNWISAAGEAKISNDVARIKEIWNPMISAWFGKVDEKHDGTPDDPRVQLITIQPEEIRYWYQTQSTVGQIVNVAVSAATGKTANPGYLRTLTKAQLAQAK